MLVFINIDQIIGAIDLGSIEGRQLLYNSLSILEHLSIGSVAWSEIDRSPIDHGPTI